MARIDAITIDNQSLRDAATGLGYRDKIPGPNGDLVNNPVSAVDFVRGRVMEFLREHIRHSRRKVARQQADAATDQQVDAIVIQ